MRVNIPLKSNSKWTIVGVNGKAESPLMLISMVAPDGQVSQGTFDLGKGIFVTEMPIQLKADDVKMVVQLRSWGVV